MYAEQIAELCEKMAGRFQAGHELWVMGNGGSACDAQHVAVEFIHPIIEKRRALPARDLVSQIPVLTAISNDKDYAKIFVDQLALWGQTGGHGAGHFHQRAIAQFDSCFAGGAKKELLTIAFSGKDGGRLRRLPSILLPCQASAFTAFKNVTSLCFTFSGI